MLAVERHREIVEVIESAGSAKVTDLAGRFGVTEETIRRDLAKLEDVGRVVRSHGGAVSSDVNQREMPFAWREAVHEEEKNAIADLALNKVKEGDRILLDASTTAWHMAKGMSDMPITVITNSAQIALVLSSRKMIDVFVLGGRLVERSLSFVGPTAEQQLAGYHVDKLFLSCQGVDLEHGISDGTEEQANLRRLMVENAEQKILLADSSKLGVRSFCQICSLIEFTEFITDSDTSADFLAGVEKMGVKTSKVPAPGGKK